MYPPYSSQMRAKYWNFDRHKYNRSFSAWVLPERAEKLRLTQIQTEGQKKDKNIMHDLPGYKNRNIS